MIENENDEDYDDDPPLPKIKWTPREDGMIIPSHEPIPNPVTTKREMNEEFEPKMRIILSSEDNNSWTTIGRKNRPYWDYHCG